MKTGKNHNKPPHIRSRKDFFDWLAQMIKIDGITKVERDTAFDDVPDYRNAGIRLIYTSIAEPGKAEGRRPARGRL
ncbi:hypothetical protein [Bradyrhizobium sp. sGM-13]|uniref:hypothetical protein n=1 Tax=Bradyrhizobium sp. sGM-13 TaxID=2831781 RepID=UPI0020BF5780|nr:hypothetical protein [Bradyrhizobium sp. sGM-13]